MTVAVALLVLGFLAACGSASTPGPDASQLVASLGAVPIPSAPAEDPTPTASTGRVQVLAMGAPVTAVLPDGGSALVVASGPAQAVTEPTSTVAGVEEHTPATITMTLTGTAGTVAMSAADLICRDDTGSTITLTPVGAADVSVAPGARAALTLTGTFASGAAQITWQPAGQPVAVWDFNIELD